MSIKINQDICIGCGACVSLAPQSFAINDQGLAEPISQKVTPEVHDAVESCPVAAISID